MLKKLSSVLRYGYIWNYNFYFIKIPGQITYSVLKIKRKLRVVISQKYKL